MFEHRGKQIYLVCGSTDMRKGIDGLSAMVNLQRICDSLTRLCSSFATAATIG